MSRIDMKSNVTSAGLLTVTADQRHNDGTWEHLARHVVNTRDDLVRQSLMDLGWTPPGDAVNTAAAMFFAISVHGAQLRKYFGGPYWLHLAEVAGIVQSVGAPTWAVAAAWLHDTREDCGVTDAQLRQQFGILTADLVAALSDLEEGNRAARNTAKRARLAAASSWAQTIKCADLISNAPSIIQHDRKFAPVFCGEARDLLEVMTKADARLRGLAISVVSQDVLEVGA